MANLALILFAPWFAILGWAYWKYPRAHVASGATRWFDAAVLVGALVLTIMAMRHSYFAPAPGAGSMWPQVLATLAAYHVFLVVLVAGWLLRPRLFRRSEP